MKTLTLTDTEFDLLVRAFEAFNDFTNDTLFEEVTVVNLWSKEPVIVTPEQFATLRDELDNVVKRTQSLRGLADKLGVKLNEEGYLS